jgi:hypothetical protein
MTVRLKMAAAIILAVVMTTGATWAFATGGLIRACMKDSSGEIRIVGATDTCRKHESLLEWNSAGGGSGGGGLIPFRGSGDPSGIICMSVYGTGGPCGDPQFEMPVASAGKLAGISVRNFSGGLDAPATVTVLVNGVPSALSVVIPAGSNDPQVGTAVVNVQPGDLIQVAVDATHGTTGYVSFNGSIEFQAN